MDYQLTWSLRARADLREITRYIGADNSAAVLIWGEDLFRHVEVLTTFPLIGPGLSGDGAPAVRRIVYGEYLVFYRVRPEPKSVEIISVWHGARGLPDFI